MSTRKLTSIHNAESRTRGAHDRATALTGNVSPAGGLIHAILFGLALFLVLAASGMVQAAPGQRANAEALTRSLMGLNNAYQHASPNAKAGALNSLRNAAAEREALLAGLIKEDPGAVLRVAVPDRVRRGMPEEVRAFIEQRLDLEGELEVLYEDYEDGSHRLRHFLKVFDERISLHFKAQPPGLLSDTAVNASGVLLDDAMALESGDNILTLAAGGDSSSSGDPAPTDNTLGEQRTAVLLVNFQDDPNNKPWTTAEASNLVFGEVSGFFQENSYQQTWLGGDVHGWYTIPINSTDSCSSSGISSQADAAAAAAGVDLSGYARLVYVFPQNTCTWAGLSTVGGNPSTAYINGAFELRIVGHELGHSLGLYHSHGMNCSGAVVCDDYPWIEYGDQMDIMGARAAHISAFQKEWLGWLDYGASPAITNVEVSGSYSLPPYEPTDASPKALRILRSIDPVTGRRSWFYAEYRQAIGYDSFLAEPQPYLVTENVLNGVVMHLGTEADRNSSFLLDMTPDSGTTYLAEDFFDPALTVGNSYDDAEAGITITTEWADATGAMVNVSFGAQPCVQASPTVSVSPSEGPWVDPGTPVTYTVTVTNNDGAVCSASAFDLSGGVPDGWSQSFTNSTLALDPGASGQTTWTVTSATAAADGFYDVTATVTHSQDSSRTDSATVTYVVSASGESDPTNTDPTAVDDSATLAQVEPIVIDVLANDSDADGDTIWVDAVSQGVKGSVTVNPDGTLTYTPGKRFKNGDRFTYDICDGVGFSTATVTIALPKSTGKPPK